MQAKAQEALSQEKQCEQQQMKYVYQYNVLEKDS